jgi:two-component system OmpR family sensor kinase
VLLIVRSASGFDGAYLDGNSVKSLTDAQVLEIANAFGSGPSATGTVDDIGTYRLFTTGAGPYAIAVGLPVSTVNDHRADPDDRRPRHHRRAAAAGGRHRRGDPRSLRPLRAVAATATRVAAQPLDSGDVTISERVPASEADASDEIGACRCGAEHPARPRRRVTGRPAAQRGAHALVRRRRQPRAAHSLAAIRGYSELSLRSLRTVNAAGDAATPAQVAISAEQSEQSLERIQSASLRMTALVEDLLLLARLDEGKELVYGAVDLTRVVVDSVADAQVAGSGHEWRWMPPKNRSSSPETRCVCIRSWRTCSPTPACTRRQERRSPRASPSRRATPSCASPTTARHRPGGRRRAVREVCARRRLRARQTGGTGLGLSIAKAIVTAHTARSPSTANRDTPSSRCDCRRARRPPRGRRAA